MVTLTPKAAEKLKELLLKNGKPEGFLRVRVSPGGCSGLSVQLDLADDQGPGDKVYESNGARVAVDPKSDLFVDGSRIDFHWTLMKSGFVLDNPNAKDGCSCGASFSV